MTWTIFEHNVGPNETDDRAPGRGGYKHVLVPLPFEAACDWWEGEFEKDPKRPCPWPEYASSGERVWEHSERSDPEDVRAQCGEMTLDEGAVGVPYTRYYTWNELNGRLDVWVVTAADL